MVVEFKSINITILVENSVHRNNLLAEHGLSFLVDCINTKGKHFSFLFDTGASSKAILNNLDELKISLKNIDAIIISHGHYDHTGGLKAILERIEKPIDIYAHKFLFYKKFSIDKKEKREIGIPFKRSELESLGANFKLIDKVSELPDGITLLTNIPTRYPLEIMPNFKTLLPTGNYVSTHLEDVAVAMLLKKQGLVILTGCGHAGILNTIYYAKETSIESKIYLVMGGFHLRSAKKERLDMTTTELKKLDVQHLIPMHCTGTIASIHLFNQLGSDIVSFANTGSKLKLPK